MTVRMEKTMETARPRSRLSRMVLANVTSHTSWRGAWTVKVSGFKEPRGSHSI